MATTSPTKRGRSLDGLDFHLVVACSVKCGRGWKLPAKPWPDHRLLLVRGGCGELTHRGGTVCLRRGHVVFGFPGEVYGLSQDERRPLVVSVVRFEAVARPRCRVAVPAPFRPRLVFEAAGFPLMEQLALRLTRAHARLPCPATGPSDALLRALLWLVREDRADAHPHGDGKIAFQELKPALNLAPSPGQPAPGLEVLARLCGMSASTFRRRMQDCFGQSPRQFLLHRRMERAKSLLLESPCTVEAIAAELGYGETSQFSRQFKKWTGVSPAAFRTSRL